MKDRIATDEPESPGDGGGVSNIIALIGAADMG
jgi:hypothetical protein